MSLSFIHTADIHLGTSFSSTSFGYALGNKRRDEIKQTFFNLLSRCEETRVDLLLIAGDLFDDHYMAVSELKDVQRKMEALTNTRIVICAGNHDALLSNSACFRRVKWSDNVTILQGTLGRVEFEDLGVDIYGFSWDKKEIRSMDFSGLTIENPDRTNILMLHGDAYTESPYLPLEIRGLVEKGFEYIALGHIHRPDVSQSLWAYPGSLEPLDFSETGKHGFIQGRIENKKVEWNFVPFSKRQFEILKLTVTPEDSYEEIYHKVNNLIEKTGQTQHLYRLVLEGMIDEVVTLSGLKERLEEQVFYIEVVDKTRSNYDIERIKRDNSDNLIGEFIKYMEDKGVEDPLVKDALYEGLHILLREKVNG